MVARAMAKDNISTTDRALVDRLAAEFVDEPNNLGVRVSNFERNADMVKWTGYLRYIYSNERHDDRQVQAITISTAVISRISRAIQNLLQRTMQISGPLAGAMPSIRISASTVLMLRIRKPISTIRQETLRLPTRGRRNQSPVRGGCSLATATSVRMSRSSLPIRGLAEGRRALRLALHTHRSRTYPVRSYTSVGRIFLPIRMQVRPMQVLRGTSE